MRPASPRSLARAACASFAVFAVAVALHGCAAPSVQYGGGSLESFKPDTDPKVIADPKRPTPTYPARPPDHFVEVHLRKWNAGNTPSEQLSWERHFKLGPGTDPDWSGTTVAVIEMTAAGSPDMQVIDAFMIKARELGGDAVVDVFRSPVIGAYEPTGYNTREARIYGHIYHGVVMRKETP